MLIEPQIIITSWAIVSLAGGGLAKVEEGEKEKNHPSHLQQADLRWTLFVDLKQILDDDHVNSDSFWSNFVQVLLTKFWL